MNKNETPGPVSEEVTDPKDHSVDNDATPSGDTEAYLRVLNQFSVSLGDIRTVEQLVWYATREVVGRMGFVDCVIYLLDADREILVQRAAIGEKNPKGEIILNRLEIPLGQGITGHVARSGESLLISDLTKDDRYLKDVIKARSEICVPLVYKDQILGVIDCEDTRLEQFTTKHLEILNTVASLVGAKLTQIATIDRLEATVEQLGAAEKTQAALFRIASISQSVEEIGHFYGEIHEVIGSLMNADNLFFGIYRKDEHRLDFPYSSEVGEHAETPSSFTGSDLDKTASGYVLRTDKPTLLSRDEFIDHIRAGDFDLIGREPTSWLGVPFRIDDNRTGILVTQSYDDEHSYSTQDADLLTYVSQQISKALSHKIAREALRESEGRFARAVAGSNEGIWDWNIETNENWFSERWCEILGFTKEELDPSFERFVTFLHPEDKGAVFDAVDAHLKKQETYDLEFRMRHKDGHFVCVRSRGQAVWNADGAPTRMAGSIQDLTEQKEAEARLRRAQKLEAMGQLTGGIAHDFNNLLAIIMGNLEFAIDKNDAGEDHSKALDLALQGAIQGADLTKRLSAFSSMQVIEDRVMDVNEIVVGMTDLLQRALGERIHVETALAEKACPAKFDPAQFESVILNLALNARDAMPKGGKIRIETEIGVAGEDSVGQEVRISVIDTGTGMTDEVRERAMEPFFTTKEVGRGSGLGLSMVYGFSMQSDGRLVIESALGEGTSVHIYLPVRALAAKPKAKGDTIPETAAAEGEVILVVEDNLEVMNLVASQLEELGYNVLRAKDGKTALEIIGTSVPLDLILSDVVLPGGIDGTEIIEQAATSRPDVPAILMSGYPARSEDDASDGRIKTPLLRKPFRKVEIAKAIRQALDNC